MGNVRYSKEKLIFNDLITWTDNSFLVYSSYSSPSLGITFLHNHLVWIHIITLRCSFICLSVIHQKWSLSCRKWKNRTSYAHNSIKHEHHPAASSPRYCSPSKWVALYIFAPHKRVLIITLRMGQIERNIEREKSLISFTALGGLSLYTVKQEKSFIFSLFLCEGNCVACY